jgi:Transglutaminase-like superfamily
MSGWRLVSILNTKNLNTCSKLHTHPDGMKKMVVIWLLLFYHIAFAQQRPVSFYEIDERVKSIDPAAPSELAYTLTKDYSTQKEKLRSIFSWITEHISYRVKGHNRNMQTNNHNKNILSADTINWGYANDVVAATVLQNKSAFCDGYARLFKTLCDYAGLRCAIISGYGNGDYSRQYKFRCNHTWNAVYIDSAWHLLDVTWASGYTNYSGDEFTKRLNEDYFMAAPENFIRDHFPDDLRWTLMENPPLPGEFNKAPYRSRSFTKYKITSYPAFNGIIEAAVGDTIQIDIESADTKADGKVSADTAISFDSSLQKLDAAVAFLEPATTGDNKQKFHYTFFVENNSIEWLHIVYNHDVILRYRLKIKKQKANLLTIITKESPVVCSYP